MTTPLSDLVIARVALENNVSVYTADDHFSRVEGLQLYVPT
jgi:predicted nucleic acid-binding protein